MLMRMSASFKLVPVVSIPGVSMTTMLLPPILASTTLISLVQDWRPLPTLRLSDATWLMNFV